MYAYSCDVPNIGNYEPLKLIVAAVGFRCVLANRYWPE